MLTTWARKHYARFVDSVFKRGSSQVVFAGSGWLFHRDSVQWLSAPTFGFEERVQSVVSFDLALKARGITLVVMPVPSKATLYPERLVRLKPRSLPNNPGFARFKAELEAEGVRIVDPTEALLVTKESETLAFLQRDTHWSFQGVRVSAELLAETFEQERLLVDEPSHSPYDHRMVAFEAFGDLVELLAYADRNPPFEPMAWDARQVIATRENRSPTQDPAAQVLLLGDSFSAVYSDPDLGLGTRSGLAEQLADLILAPVERIAIPGGGPNRARQALALRPGILDNKRVVIWQFSQRDLLLEPSWLRVDLPAASQNQRLPEASGVQLSGAPLKVRGRVLAVTEMPEDFGYADCLVMVRYQQLSGSVAGADGEFLVAYWGWRDWQRLDVASFRPGDVHELELEPLAQRHDLEQTCWMDSVGLDRHAWFPVSSRVTGRSP